MERQEPSSIKPAVTYQDKLWTQIDILDDVKELALQVGSATGSSTFMGNPEFNKALGVLSQAQKRLLDTMTKNVDTVLTKPDDTMVWESLDIEAVKRTLFSYSTNAEHQEDIKASVEAIRESLTEVNRSIERIDQTSRDIWNELE